MEAICFSEISVDFHRINGMTGQKIVLFISTTLGAHKSAITTEYSYFVKIDSFSGVKNSLLCVAKKLEFENNCVRNIS
jgi:hypothetical protein